MLYVAKLILKFTDFTNLSIKDGEGHPTSHALWYGFLVDPRSLGNLFLF